MPYFVWRFGDCPLFLMEFARKTISNYPEWMEKASTHHIKTGDGYYNGQESNDYPIVGISWDNAAAYCRWLSEKTGLAFKLPSEAQWEKAARGTDGRKYPWGYREPDRNLANFLNISTKTDKVNSHHQGASPYGILNMAGNAAEWCGDVFPGKERGTRAAQGGSFFDNEQSINCFSHKIWNPSERTSTLGFRLCLVTRK